MIAITQGKVVFCTEDTKHICKRCVHELIPAETVLKTLQGKNKTKQKNLQELGGWLS